MRKSSLITPRKRKNKISFNLSKSQNCKLNEVNYAFIFQICSHVNQFVGLP